MTRPLPAARPVQLQECRDLPDRAAPRRRAAPCAARAGRAGFNGPIRTQVRYNVNGKNGVGVFDVIYTPELPAVWTGQVREAVENGSLVFVLPVEVRMPGRYVISGRVDDARGTIDDVQRRGE